MNWTSTDRHAAPLPEGRSSFAEADGGTPWLGTRRGFVLAWVLVLLALGGSAAWAWDDMMSQLERAPRPASITRGTSA